MPPCPHYSSSARNRPLGCRRGAMLVASGAELVTARHGHSPWRWHPLQMINRSAPYLAQKKPIFKQLAEAFLGALATRIAERPARFTSRGQWEVRTTRGPSKRTAWTSWREPPTPGHEKSAPGGPRPSAGVCPGATWHGPPALKKPWCKLWGRVEKPRRKLLGQVKTPWCKLWGKIKKPRCKLLGQHKYGVYPHMVYTHINMPICVYAYAYT